MIRVLIVDDEPLARDTIRMVLERDPELEIVGSCSGVDAVRIASSERPDLMYLDIQMPEVDGFEVIEKLGLGTIPVVIFVTAYDQFALKAFEAHALDYVLKPFDDRRFLESLARAKKQLGVVTERHLERFVVRERGRIVLVYADDVDFIEAADDYVELHTAGETHLVRGRIAELEQRLDPRRFLRIHRSTIVNLARVTELHPLEGGVVLQDGTCLRVSRGRRAELEERMAGSPHAGDRSPQTKRR